MFLQKRNIVVAALVLFFTVLSGQVSAQHNPYLDKKKKNKPSGQMAKQTRKDMKKQKRDYKKQVKRSQKQGRRRANRFYK